MAEAPLNKMCSSKYTMPETCGLNMDPKNKVPPHSADSSFAMGPTIIDPATGGPYSMLNKNKEEKRRKFVACNTLEMGDPLNMQFCYERSRQRLHSIGAQTKLAAQKFNGCSARGWVMLVHIPSARDQERNQGQVVWCLVWHTLKCILPPMPLLLPEEFEYSDTVNIRKFDDRWGDGSGVEHFFSTHGDKAKSELRRSINVERKQAKIAYDTLRAVTRIPHDSTRSVDDNLRSLQPFMFVGEVVADGPNRGKCVSWPVTGVARQNWHLLSM